MLRRSVILITMAVRHLRTSQIAQYPGVYVNTIRLCEADALLPTIPRAPNGYQQYTVYILSRRVWRISADRWLSTYCNQNSVQAMLRQPGYMSEKTPSR